MFCVNQSEARIYLTQEPVTIVDDIIDQDTVTIPYDHIVSGDKDTSHLDVRAQGGRSAGVLQVDANLGGAGLDCSHAVVVVS